MMIMIEAQTTVVNVCNFFFLQTIWNEELLILFLLIWNNTDKQTSNSSESCGSDSDDFSESETDEYNDECDDDDERYSKGKGQRQKTKTMEDKIEMLQKEMQNRGASIMDSCKKAYVMREELQGAIKKLGKKLPPNTIDELIFKLGGPTQVAVSE